MKKALYILTALCPLLIQASCRINTIRVYNHAGGKIKCTHGTVKYDLSKLECICPHDTSGTINNGSSKDIKGACGSIVCTFTDHQENLSSPVDVKNGCHYSVHNGFVHVTQCGGYDGYYK